MRRILFAASLAAACVLGTTGTASADIGDIRTFGISEDDPEGTAETAEIEGVIRCTTTIEYGLIIKVSQSGPEAATDPAPNPPSDTNDGDIEGVGAFGPNAGNEANSPCSTNLQSWQLVVERNRDSGTFQDRTATGTGVFALAGTSAENGDRGPGPFIGDSEYDIANRGFQRTDP